MTDWRTDWRSVIQVLPFSRKSWIGSNKHLHTQPSYHIYLPHPCIIHFIPWPIFSANQKPRLLGVYDPIYPFRGSHVPLPWFTRKGYMAAILNGLYTIPPRGISNSIPNGHVRQYIDCIIGLNTLLYHHSFWIWPNFETETFQYMLWLIDPGDWGYFRAWTGVLPSRDMFCCSMLQAQVPIIYVAGWWQLPDALHCQDVEADCLDVLIIFSMGI